MGESSDGGCPKTHRDLIGVPAAELSVEDWWWSLSESETHEVTHRDRSHQESLRDLVGVWSLPPKWAWRVGGRLVPAKVPSYESEKTPA